MEQHRQETIRLLLIDGHSDFRWRVEKALRKQYYVLDSVEIAQVNISLCNTFCPEILVFFIPSPDESVCRMIQTLRDHNPEYRFAVVADSYEVGSVASLILAGCSACFSGVTDTDEIVGGVERLTRGIGTYGYHALKKLREELSRSSGISGFPLTYQPEERELQIARLIFEGATNREIAQTLYLSEGTVKNLISTLFEKYGFKSRAQLISLLFYNDRM